MLGCVEAGNLFFTVYTETCYSFNDKEGNGNRCNRPCRNADNPNKLKS